MMLASLKDLLMIGQLGSIGLGTPRSLAAELLGPPDDYSMNSQNRQQKQLPPMTWKYGDIELHFDDMTDQVYLIFLERFTIPQGGPKLCLDPWIIQHTVTVDTLQHALAQAHIPAQQCQKPYDDPETLRLRAGAGVDFLFTIRQTAYGPPVGLTVISYSDFDSDV
jgi:hypothetical protein